MSGGNCEADMSSTPTTLLFTASYSEICIRNVVSLSSFIGYQGTGCILSAQKTDISCGMDLMPDPEIRDVLSCVDTMQCGKEGLGRSFERALPCPGC
jgi:hypothetical protein